MENTNKVKKHYKQNKIYIHCKPETTKYIKEYAEANDMPISKVASNLIEIGLASVRIADKGSK